MVKKFKKWFRENYLYIIITILLIAVVFNDFIFKGLEYNVSYDIKNENVHFYTEFKKLVSSGEMPFWTHNSFLGANFIASMSYNFIGDIFAYLIFLFKDTPILKVILYGQFIKTVTSIVLMSLLLKEFGIKNKTVRFTFSIIYAFSGFVMIFLGIPAFLTFYTLLPLLALAIEKYLKNNKISLIFISSFLLVGSCFYFFWSTSIFLLIYWPVRYYMVKESFNLKDFILSSIKAILFYAVGALIYAPVLLPTFDFMTSNSRVSADLSLSFFWSKKTYLDIFIKAISCPFYLNTNIPNYFSMGYYRLEQIPLFTSSLVTVLIPQLFSLENKKIRYSILSIYVVLLSLLCCQYGCSLMSGLSEPSFRWTILIVMTNIVVAAYLFENVEFKKNIFLSELLLIVLGLGIVFYVVKNPFEYKPQTYSIFFELILILIFGALIISGNKYANYLMLIFVMGEIIFNSNLSIEAKLGMNPQGTYNYESIGIPTNYFKELQKNNSNEFYRVYIDKNYSDIDQQKEFSYNAGMYLDFKGDYGYDSTYQTSMNPFLEYTGNIFWWFEVSDPELRDSLSTKYYVVKSPDELPNDNFTYIENIGDSEFKLYLNNNYKPFGYTATSLVEEEKLWDPISQDEKYNILSKNVVIREKTINDYNLDDYINADEKYLSIEKYTNNTLSANINVSDKSLLFLSIPYDKGWTIKDNGKETNIFIANGGMMAIALEKGEHQIDLDFVPYGWKAGLNISCAMIILSTILIVKNKKSYKHNN